jgi:acyl-CoA dehydrogenase
MNLPAVALMVVNEELWRTIVPFTFPPDSPNLYMLMAVATPEQKQKYLEPYARGEAKSCIAVSEPGAGADPSGMITRAERVGDEWVVNGRKLWMLDTGANVSCRVRSAANASIMYRCNVEGDCRAVL